MRLTPSFVIFRADAAERDLARARWLAREGRVTEAAREYDAVLAEHPDLATGWMELFELLRRDGRLEQALASAEAARQHFGPRAAMPLALRGAALTELGRTREALRALEAALERDGNLALAWHELAYAAYRVGEYSRALLALDRAFALEPHTDSLMLRGRILREAGQYEAAEVAFEAAQQATDHDVPQRDAQREIAATRRAASLGGKPPRQFTAREAVFAETGSVVLEPGAEDAKLPATLARSIAGLRALVSRLGWHPAAVAGAHPGDAALAAAAARAVSADVVAAAALDPADRPLVVSVMNHGSEEWARQVSRLARWRAGATFALVQVPRVSEPADIVGVIRALAVEAAHAATTAALELSEDPPDIAEAAALAANDQAPWRRRSRQGPVGGSQ